MKRKKGSLILPLVLLYFLVPFGVYGQVRITEVMYDLEGTDAKREWIEVQNTGSEPVDLSEWRFFEGESNHKLTLSKGNALLTPGAYAVIADDSATFLSDWSSFSGTLFDSSFSLSNSGETLAIRDQDLNDVDSISYSKDMGGAGDGNSLHREGSAFKAGSPTPGAAFAGGSTATPKSDNSSNEAHTPSASAKTTASAVALNTKKEPALEEPDSIIAKAGGDRTVTVGASEYFEAKAYTDAGKTHPYASFRWNFGNGVVMDGKRVLFHYDYPGTYSVLLSAMTPDKLAGTDRIIVKAEPADVTVSKVGNNFIELSNNASRDIDLSLWHLKKGASEFSFPEGTVILGRSTISFPALATGLDTKNPHDVALLYPNGAIAHAYGIPAPTGRSEASRSASVRTPVLGSVKAGVSVAQDNATSSLHKEAGIEEGVQETPLLTVASAQTPIENLEGGGIYKWLVALGGILTVAVGALLVVRPRKKSIADEIKILD